MSIEEGYSWSPPSFRQAELAGLLIPGTDPAYLPTAMVLAKNAALAEVFEQLLTEASMGQPLSELGWSYVHQANRLNNEVARQAGSIGTTYNDVMQAANVEVERIAGATRQYPKSSALRAAKMIIIGPQEDPLA
jgi:hypothetical protein